MKSRLSALLALVLLASACNASEGASPKDSTKDDPGAHEPGHPGGAAPGSTDAKLEEAFDQGKITLDQMWIYKVKARFEPSDVPAEFQGDPSLRTHNVLTSLTSVLPTLGAEAQQELIGYYIPPVYSGSKLHFSAEDDDKSTALPKTAAGDKDDGADNPFVPDPKGEYNTYETPDFKIWWEKEQPANGSDAALVAQVLGEVKAKFEALTGKRMLSDAGIHEFTDKNGVKKRWGDGGNGKLDVFIGNVRPELAVTVPYPPGCSESPSFILLRWSMAHDRQMIEWAISHEFFHVMQFTYERGRDCAEYSDVDEGTANWATQYAYPANNRERDHDSFFMTAHYPLDMWSYASWTFYFYMERVLGAASIPQIFQQYSSLSDMEAVQEVLPGGFERHLPQYMIREWNQTDLVDDFMDWDQLGWKPRYNEYGESIPVVEVKANQNGHFSFEEDVLLKPLARHYAHFKFTDPKVRSVRFEGTLGYEPTKKARLKALLKIQGQWQTVDWSQNVESKELCRGFHDEKVEEMVLMYSDIDYPRMDGNPGKRVETGYELLATNLSCNRWKGNFTAELLTVDGDGLTKSISTTAKATFVQNGKNSSGTFKGSFVVESGQGSFTYSGQVRGQDNVICSGTHTFQFQIPAMSANSLSLNPYNVGSGGDRRYAGSISIVSPQTFMVTHTCPGGKPPVVSAVIPVVWSTSYNSVAEPDGTLAGTFNVPAGNGGFLKYKWDIQPVEE